MEFEVPCFRPTQQPERSVKVKGIVTSAVVGSIAMFAWQSISQTVLPWHMATMNEVADSTAGFIPKIRQVAPSNGVYFSKYGSLLAVRIAPDNADQTSMAAFGPMLLKQAAVNLVVVMALCLLAGFLADRSMLGVAKAAALSGFAMVLVREGSMVIWYGFTAAWAVVSIVDQTISFFLTGLVVGGLMNRFGRDGAVALPEGQGYRISGGRSTASR